MIIPGQTLRIIRPVEPFRERTVFEGMSYGVGPAGYDVRIAQTVRVPVGRFVLASTLEHFNMPADVLGYVKDKSSWARQGLLVQNTMVEPGWRGFLTLEISLEQDAEGGVAFITVEAGSPIAQIVFHRLEAPAEQPYAGKYQDQAAGPQASRWER